MNLKNTKGSILLMVVVLSMTFLVLAILTMRVIFDVNQTQGSEFEVAKLRLFYAADGVSEVAMYAAFKNLMYDARGHNPVANGRVLTSLRVTRTGGAAAAPATPSDNIWPNVWSIATSTPPALANMTETLPTPAAALNTRNFTINTGGGGDVDFNVKYKSNSSDTFILSLADSDPLKRRAATRSLAGGGTVPDFRQIWYMHLSTQNPNFNNAYNYGADDFWCVYEDYFPGDGPQIMVRATMWQEFVLPPVVDSVTLARDISDSDLIRRGDGWPGVIVDALPGSRGFPSQVRKFQNDITAASIPGAEIATISEGVFYSTSPAPGNNIVVATAANNYFSGGNARRRFFVILAEARFNDAGRAKGGAFAETYRIETRFFIEDQRLESQYANYIAGYNGGAGAAATIGGTAATAQDYNKPRVSFYFRSRIPRPI